MVTEDAEETFELLIAGARYNDVDDVEEALAAGADVNAQDDNGRTGMMQHVQGKKAIILVEC